MAETKKPVKTETKKEKAKSEPQKSVMGFYQHLRESFREHSPEQQVELRKKMIEWRAQPRIFKIEKPSRLDRARTLGYKAKNGILVFRVTIERGGRAKQRPTTKRRSKRFSVKKILRMNYQWVAEQRVQNAHRNLAVLNSYKVAKDGQFYFFEVIAVNPDVPEIKSDPNFQWLKNPGAKFRVFRGMTNAGKKSRGMTDHNPNLKVRPSLRSWNRRGR
jgi:large subunit ribosomal protein L15e